MDKMSAKFNQMMGKENHKTTKDVNIVEKQAN
jgi:N-acetylmuramoyl-L-alanine amidase CwlA